MYKDLTGELMEFIGHNPTRYHVVSTLKNELLHAGYEELDETESCRLLPGGRYFTVRNGSSLIAFRMPEKEITGFCIAAAHTDSPGLKIKGLNAVMREQGAYLKLNVEPYGGLLMAPWFDRPLSMAGRVVVKTQGKIKEVLINADRDLLLIPSVAIHMKRDANKGFEYNAQKDLLPLMGLIDEEDACGNALADIIAKEAGVEKEDIVSCDLFVYDRTPGRVWGEKDEFFSIRHIDDLQCAYAAFKGFLDSGNEPSGQTSVPVLALFDNEEVGSLSRQGADSTFLEDEIGRIAESAGLSGQALRSVIGKSFMISADNAHALHPNHPELHDPVNHPVMNRGIVIKHAASGKYTTDAVSEALFKQICEMAQVPHQEFYNRSDMPGGSTLGNIVNGHVSISSVDIGLAQLAMHSCYETAGVCDTAYMAEAMKVFFALTLEKADGLYEWKCLTAHT